MPTMANSAPISMGILSSPAEIHAHNSQVRARMPNPITKPRMIRGLPSTLVDAFILLLLERIWALWDYVSCECVREARQLCEYNRADRNRLAADRRGAPDDPSCCRHQRPQKRKITLRGIGCSRILHRLDIKRKRHTRIQVVKKLDGPRQK